MKIEAIQFLAIPFIAGLVVIFLMGLGVRWLLDLATGFLRFQNEEPLWNDWKEPGKYIGRAESLLFYLALLAGEPIAIFGYLAFKVAAKWENWSHIVRIPEMATSKEEEASGTPFDFSSPAFEMRHRFGSWLLARFLIGTMANVLIAIAAFSVFHLVKALLL